MGPNEENERRDSLWVSSKAMNDDRELSAANRIQCEESLNIQPRVPRIKALGLYFEDLEIDCFAICNGNYR